MGRPRKIPAVLVEATVKKNAKLAALPSDTARLGFFYVVLAEGKLSKPIAGQFASKTLFIEVAGRFARYLRNYLDVGILEEAPRLCERCAERWLPEKPKRGVLVIHDWHEFQYDPLKVERQRAYEARQREPQMWPDSDGVSDAHSDGVSDAHAATNPTPDPRAGARGGARRTSNVERRTGESVPPPESVAHANGAEPTLSKTEFEAWRSFGPEWNGVKAAWIDRGFRLPPSGEPDDPAGQRALLYPILTERPTSLAAWIGAAPGLSSHDVVAWTLERWKEIQAAVPDDEPRLDEAAITADREQAARDLEKLVAQL